MRPFFLKKASPIRVDFCAPCRGFEEGKHVHLQLLSMPDDAAIIADPRIRALALLRGMSALRTT